MTKTDLIDDDVTHAVERAINNGISPEEFARHCAAVWDAVLFDKRRLDNERWSKMVNAK